MKACYIVTFIIQNFVNQISIYVQHKLNICIIYELLQITSVLNNLYINTQQ